MWKKIHSNRDPRDTLYSEIKKEFRPWFTGLGKSIANALSVNPKFSFFLMLVFMVLSASLSFTVFRHREKATKVPEGYKPNAMQNGFSAIILATGQLRETIALKAIVDSLTAKKELNASDSILLDSTLNRLQKINPPLK